MTAFATTADLARVIARDARSLAAEVRLCPDDATLWAVPAGVTNSVGTLALHVAGNLRHFIGTILGGTGYVRDRAREFGVRDLPREAVAAELEEAVAVVERVLPTVGDAAWHAPYPEPVNGTILPAGAFLMHLAAHGGFHLGQAGYLRRIVTGENRPSGTMSLPALLRP